MGQLENGDFRINLDGDDYYIAEEIEMMQITDKNGFAKPVAFKWQEYEGAEVVTVGIDYILSTMPIAEQKAAVVGDRYECMIGGKIDYIWYGMLEPRRWFRLRPVTQEEYEEHYPLPE